jgi:hypothetical protein
MAADKAIRKLGVFLNATHYCSILEKDVSAWVCPSAQDVCWAEVGHTLAMKRMGGQGEYPY